MILSLIACSPVAVEVTAPAEHTVVVLVVDGVRHEDSLGDHSGLVDAHPSQLMPRTWRELVPLAAQPSAMNAGMTITAPAHCALLSGRRQAFGNFPVHDEAGLYRPEWPVLGEELQLQRGLAPDEMAMAANTRFLEGLTHSLQAGAPPSESVYVGSGNGHDPSGDDSDVIDALVEAMEPGTVRFALANLHAVDTSAHYGIAESHPQHIRAVDGDVADFWSWLQAHPSYAGRTHLVVVSDHGRHDAGAGKHPWREHGDSCHGCRMLPLLVLGPDVRIGPSSDPVTLEDLGSTLAALMDIELPWARGRVAHELFDLELRAGPTGTVELAAAADAVGFIELQDDPAHRGRVEVDGVQLSDPEAFDVQDLAMGVGAEEPWACFRELRFEEAGPIPWAPRCFRRVEGSWEEATPLQDEVGPTWRVALGPRPSGGVRAAWIENINGVVGNDEDDYDYERVRLRVATGDGTSWTTVELGTLTGLPTGITMSTGDDAFFLAWSAAQEGKDARHHRRIQVAELFEDAPPVVLDLDVSDLVGPVHRAERPALAPDAARRLALVVTTEEGSSLVLAEGDDSGWYGYDVIDAPGSVLPHVTPTWMGDAVFFGVDVEGLAQVCRTLPGQSPQCVGTATARLEGPATTEGAVLALVDRGIGAFARADLSLDAWALD